MRYFKNPKWSKRIFPDAIWDFSFNEGSSIYLTFDDGPDPEVTPFVLEILERFDVQATFFCLGENVESNPEVYQQIISKGHSVGNHGMRHLKGLKTKTTDYLDNVIHASKVIDSKLFRPPYGKITPEQYKAVRANGFEVVFWSAMAYDFDENLSSSKRLKKMKSLSKNGAIFVFHDSIKAYEVLKTDLPELLRYWKSNHFTFKKVLVD